MKRKNKLNSLFKLALWHCNNKNLKQTSSEQGFVIPLVIGLGLLIILVGMTMINRSSDDQVDASIQKKTADSLAIAESGMSRVLSMFNTNQYNVYLINNYDPMDTSVSPNKTYLGDNGVWDDGDEVTSLRSQDNQWASPNGAGACPISGLPTPLVESQIDGGTYRLLAYRYVDPNVNTIGGEKGHLLVEGQKNGSTSRVQVTFDIAQSPLPKTFPGVFASNIVTLGNADVLAVNVPDSANVICPGCIGNIDATDCVGGLDTNELREAVGAGPQSVIAGKIYLADPKLPPVPKAPTTLCSETSTLDCKIEIGPFNANGATQPLTLPSQDDIEIRLKAAANASPVIPPEQALLAPWHYEVSQDANGVSMTKVDLTIDTLDTGGGDRAIAPVRIYLEGNLELNGSTGSIIHNNTIDRAAIFGNDDNPNQVISFSGSPAGATKVFVYASNGTVSLNGNNNIEGVIWGRQWTSNGQPVLTVPDNAAELLGNMFGIKFQQAGVQVNTTSNLTGWKRENVR